MKKVLTMLILILSLIAISSFYGYKYYFRTNSALHITIIGKKDDAAARILYTTAINSAPESTTIVWRESDAAYPTLDKPAAYICGDSACSIPAFTQNQVLALIKHHQTSTSIMQNKTIATTYYGWIMIPIFWLFGLLLGLTSCAIPLILMMTSIFRDGATTLTKKNAIILSCVYVILLAIIYALVGVITAVLGQYFHLYIQNTWTIGIFSLLLICFASSTLGLFRLQLTPHRWLHLISSKSRSTESNPYINTIIMGTLATLIASPCIAAPLMGVLSFIAYTGNTQLGGIGLFFTGIGFGTPLMAFSVIGSKILVVSGKWHKSINHFLGIILLGAAIWLFSQTISHKTSMLLWSALAIFTSIYMGDLIKQEQESADEEKSTEAVCNLEGEEAVSKKVISKNISAISKMVSLMIFLYGVMLFVGAFLGSVNPLHPVAVQIEAYENVKTLSVPFNDVKDLSSLKQELDMARALHKPVLLLFTADWCAACKEMKESVFPVTEVQALLSNFYLLRVDITNSDVKILELTKQFHVIGPPTILFFDAKGSMLDIRFDGAVDANKLTEGLQSIITK